MHWAFLMQINLLFLICFLSSFTSRPLTTDNFFVHSLSLSLFVCFTLLFLIQSVFFFTHSDSIPFFIRLFFFLVSYDSMGISCLFCSLFHSYLFCHDHSDYWHFWHNSVLFYTSVCFALVSLFWWAIYECLIHIFSAVSFALFPLIHWASFACSVNFFSSICFASF